MFIAPVTPPSVIFAATISLLFLIGYSSQRSGVCSVRAVREVFERRRVHRFAGFALAAACAMLVMALADHLGARPFALIMGTRPDLLAVVGGTLFGLGSWLSGQCAIGTLAALASGQLWRSAALGAMFVAALVLGPHMSAAALMLPERAAVLSPLAGRDVTAAIAGAMIAGLSFAYIHHRIGWRRPRSGWSPLVAMSLIGAASGALFTLDQHWLYTSRIADFAYGRGSLGGILTLLALVAGMLSAALRGGTFRWQRGTRRDWTRAILGGLLMGFGTILVPGGNDAMLFTGIPLLLPNLLVAYAAFIATLCLAIRLAPRRVSNADQQPHPDHQHQERG
jgi:MFS family permease